MVRHLLIALGIGAAAVAGPPPTPTVNPYAPGAVDGYVAVGVWPQAPEGGPGDLGDPAGYTVHLVPRSDPDRELVFPAGRWFLPAREREVYRWWIEGNGRIGPYQTILHWRLREVTPDYPGGRPHVHPTVRAGTVRWPCSGPGSLQLRLLALPETVTLPGPWDHLPLAFARRVPCAAGPGGVPMPPATVVAAVYDREARRYLALSRPFAVAAGGTVSVDPRPPAAPATDVLLRLRRPRARDLRRGEPPTLEVALSVDGGAARPPDATVRDPFSVDALWYGVTGRVATVRVRSRLYRAEPLELALPSGGVAFAEARLHELPSLEVDLDLPEEMLEREREVAVEVRRPGGEEPLAREEIAEPVATLRFPHLPAERLTAVLVAGPWRWQEEADLSAGEDRVVSFRPEVIRVTGTVYHGREPAEATVGFSTGGGRETVVRTDGDGRYRALLYRPGFYMVTVRLEDGSPPWVEMPEEPIERDTELDLHLPDNRYAVRVLDAAGGTPIRGAEVRVESRAESGPVSTFAVTTGEDGVAVIPPLRPGSVRLVANAHGYREGSVEAPVPEDAGERELEIRLEREEAGRAVELVLPDGRPASTAELLLLGPPPGLPRLWRGQADARGRATLPARPGAPLLAVRHPEAGVLLAPTPPPEGEPVRIRLPGRAPPLAVRPVRPGGAPAPLPFVRLAVRVGGVWVPAGQLLAVRWEEGALVLDGLPAAPVTLVAWRADPGLDAAGAAGLSDRAVTVAPPWPGPLTLEIVEP